MELTGRFWECCNGSIMAIACIFYVLGLIWFRRRGRGRLQVGSERLRVPAGSMGWPLLGETLDLITAFKTSNPEPFVDSRRKRYGGRVFKTHLLGKKTIFSTDAETNKMVLQKEGVLFGSCYPQTLINLLGKHSLLLTPHGQLHKKLHTLTWTSFSNASTLKEHHMPHIHNLVQTTLLSWPSNHVLYLQDEAKKMTFNLSLKQLMSVSPGEWTEKLRHYYLQLIDGFFSLPINIYGTTYNKAIKARSAVVKELEVVVRERRAKESKSKIEEEEEEGDMLSGLLREECLSDEQIVDIILSLLVAGYETTSVVITLAVYFLTCNPDALAHLRMEHLNIAKGKEEGQTLDWKEYKAMTFTHYVINESLRLGNVVGGVFRKALTNVETNGGYLIPKDWTVFVSFRGVHLDEHMYGLDARSFNPWRWQGKNPFTNFGSLFSPFGGGPRFCPGYELARLEIAIFLHHLVTQFSWEMAEADNPIFFPTTRMAKRFPIHVQKLGDARHSSVSRQSSVH